MKRFQRLQAEEGIIKRFEKPAVANALYSEAKRGSKKQTRKPNAYKKSKDMSKIRCFGCNEFGHYKNKCQNEKNQDKKESSKPDEDEAVALDLIAQLVDSAEANFSETMSSRIWL